MPSPAPLAKFYTEQNVWETEVARYGIDIWMTTSAIVNGFKLCQSNLGVKIHDAKDPGTHLAPMFRQVIWTPLSRLMELNESHWKQVKGSVSVKTFENAVQAEPEAVKVNSGQHAPAVQGGLQAVLLPVEGNLQPRVL